MNSVLSKLIVNMFSLEIFNRSNAILHLDIRAPILLSRIVILVSAIKGVKFEGTDRHGLSFIYLKNRGPEIPNSGTQAILFSILSSNPFEKFSRLCS